MAKRALCVGINRYPNPALELKGCANDAMGWASLLVDHFDFSRSDVALLTNKAATKQNIVAAIDDLLVASRSGDVLAFTYAAHGTYVASDDSTSRSGSEPDTYDEAICPYDCEEELLTDSELREMFAGIPRGVVLTVIGDSCHSGSATRGLDFEWTPDQRRPRFCDPRQLGLPDISDMRRVARPDRLVGHPQEEVSEIRLSACRPDQYAYDVRFGRTYHGAMTRTAIAVITASGCELTYAQLQRRLAVALREANYDQEPQLEGTARLKRRPIFS